MLEEDIYGDQRLFHLLSDRSVIPGSDFYVAQGLTAAAALIRSPRESPKHLPGPGRHLVGMRRCTCVGPAGKYDVFRGIEIMNRPWPVGVVQRTLILKEEEQG